MIPDPGKRSRRGVIREIAVALAGALLAASCTLPGPAGTSTVREVGSGSWGQDELWDDGRAEVSAYDAVMMRYGQARRFNAYLIVVKEDFSRRQLVKADPGHDTTDLFPVLKFNHVIHFPTGTYTYHQMLSVFFDRSDMVPVKLSLAHFEWCGNTYKELRRRDRHAVLEVNTYWDGEAERRFDIRFSGRTLLYDELPVWLRSIPWEPKERNWGIEVIPTQVSSRAGNPVPRSATLKIPSGTEEVLVGSETLEAFRVGMEWEPGEDVFWFHAAPPHVLLGWDRSDGGSYRLKWSRRFPYWELNQPGDQSRLEVPTPPAVDNR